MREKMWNALRRGDYDRASHQFQEEIRRQPDLDPSLVLAGFDLERLNPSAAPTPWRNQVQEDLGPLYNIGDSFFRHKWPTVLKLYEPACENESLTDTARAYISCYAMRAAQMLGNLPKAQEIARDALTRNENNPFVLFLALRIELDSSFLECPDLLLIALASYSPSENAQFYLDPAWAVLVHAVRAWFNHRDEERDLAQNHISTFLELGAPFPLDVVMALPFFKKMEDSLAQSVIQSNLPYFAPGFLETRLRFGSQTPEERAELTNNALATDSKNPYFRLMAALQSLQQQSGGSLAESEKALKQVLEDFPWYLEAFSTAIVTGLENRFDDQFIISCAYALLDLATSFFTTYRWLFSILEQHQRRDLLGIIVADVIKQDEWSRECNIQDEAAAIEILASNRQYDEIYAYLNERAVAADLNEIAMLLSSRGGRLALETPATIDALTPSVKYSSALACANMGLYPLALSILDALEETTADIRDLEDKLEAVRVLCEVKPRLLAGDFDAQLLERFLLLVAKIGVDTYIINVALTTQRLLERGRHYQAEQLLRLCPEILPRPEVLAVAVDGMTDDLKDPGAALILLEKNLILAKESPECWREKCEALEKLGRGEEWLQTAREGQRLFPEEAVFFIEEGLALVMLGEVVRALEILYSGLQKQPSDRRGLKGFRDLAPQFDAHEQLISILKASLEQDPNDIETRDHLISLLGSVEDFARVRLTHLYHRVYRYAPNDNKREELRAMLTALRRRLIVASAEVTSQLERFAAQYRTRVAAAIREAQPLFEGRLLAAVFSESPSQNESRKKDFGLSVLADFRGLIEIEQQGSRTLIQDILEQQGFDGYFELIELETLWASMRQEDRSPLDRLLSGVAVDDFPFLNSLRMVDYHCNLLLETFEHYLVCYVASGSFVRGTQRIDSDIDVWIVIDDSDVKTMSREELLKKLREINQQFHHRSRAEFAVPKKIHAQTYILTSYWQRLQELNPVTISLLRDGVPFYDSGLFNAWSHLLRQGKLRSTKESLELQLEHVGAWRRTATEKIQDLSRELAQPIKYGTIKMLELLLQTLELPVGHYRQVIKMAQEELVERRQLLTAQEMKTAQDAVAYVKSVEAGQSPQLEETLELYNRVEGFIDTCRNIYRQLVFEKERAQLESIVSRIDGILGNVQNDQKNRADSYWIQRLRSFRDDAQQALDESGEQSLNALRVAALTERISDVALWLMSTRNVDEGTMPVDRSD